jgi:hypothetical protein
MFIAGLFTIAKIKNQHRCPSTEQWIKKKKVVYLKMTSSWALVAHNCNPSYSGSRDQEDQGSKSARQIVPQDSILKNPSKNKAGGVAQGEGPEFKPQSRKKQTNAIKK